MSTTAEDTLKAKSKDNSIISGGHLVAKALKNEGVDILFTLLGGHIVDIYDGRVSEGIRIIDVRHEQVALHAADGYARQTGKTEFRSESPVIHIGGQGSMTRHMQGALHTGTGFSMAAKAAHPNKEAIAKTGKCAAINIWVDQQEYAPGTKHKRYMSNA